MQRIIVSMFIHELTETAYVTQYFCVFETFLYLFFHQVINLHEIKQKQSICVELNCEFSILIHNKLISCYYCVLFFVFFIRDVIFFDREFTCELSVCCILHKSWKSEYFTWFKIQIWFYVLWNWFIMRDWSYHDC